MTWPGGTASRHLASWVFSATPQGHKHRNSIYIPDNNTVPEVLNTAKPPRATQACTHPQLPSCVLTAPHHPQGHTVTLSGLLKEFPALSHSRSHGGSELHTDVQVGMEVTSSHGMPLQRQLRLRHTPSPSDGECQHRWSHRQRRFLCLFSERQRVVRHGLDIGQWALCPTPTCPTTHPGAPGQPPCTCGAHAVHTHRTAHQPLGPRSCAHGSRQSVTPGAHGPRSHVQRVHSPHLARALAPALTPPRFPSPLVFLETLLSIPLP